MYIRMYTDKNDSPSSLVRSVFSMFLHIQQTLKVTLEPDPDTYIEPSNSRETYFGFVLGLSTNMMRSAVKVSLNTLVWVSKTIIVSRSDAIKSLLDRLFP